MKKLLFISALFAWSCSLNAQKIKVTESAETIGGGSNNALVVTIYQAAPDVIEKELKSLMKDYNAKVSPKDGGWFGDNAVIKKMGNNTVDIYARLEKAGNDETKLIMAFDMGGSYISSGKHEKEFKVAKDIVQNFATKTTTTGIETLVKSEQKTYDKLNEDQKKLEKENKNLNDEIANYRQKIDEYNQKIKKNQGDIETNKSSQGKKKEDIAMQEKALNAAKDKQKIVN